jgi:hypothetical protein
MKTYVRAHRRLYGSIAGIIAWVVAVVYLYVTPEQSMTGNGLYRVVLLYGHSLCWVLLGCASFLWAFEKSTRVSIVLIYAAGGVYGVFMGALLLAS